MKEEKKTRKEIQEEREEHSFNQGRQNADSKWKDAIDNRIKLLEIQVGIPELKKLRKDTMYRWDD